jgi:outer membrane protein
LLNDNNSIMKKLTVILFVALFLLVAVLYFFQFSGNKSPKGEKSGSGVNSNAQGIVYVNIDSIILNFDMTRDRRNDLLVKQKNAEGELNTKGSQYEKGVKDYQEKVNKGLVTRAQAAQIEQGLLQQQQELVALRDKLQNDLMEEEQVINRQIIDYITKYLEDNKSDYNYQFILGKSFGSVVLYSDSSYEITQRVLDALNKKYQAEKK